MNGPKVENAALEKSDQMLESLVDPPVLRQAAADISVVRCRATIREVFVAKTSQTISRKDRSIPDGLLVL